MNTTYYPCESIDPAIRCPRLQLAYETMMSIDEPRALLFIKEKGLLDEYLEWSSTSD